MIGRPLASPPRCLCRLCRFITEMRSSANKIALFIDGANLYATSKTLGFDIDFKRLLQEYESRGTLVRALYYTSIIEDQEYTAVRPLIDWLDYNGYTVVSKPAKEFDDGEGRRKFKRSMSMELVVDALELSNHIDHIVLFSGDGDFRSLVEAVQRRGVRPRYCGLDTVNDCRRAAAPSRCLYRPSGIQDQRSDAQLRANRAKV